MISHLRAALFVLLLLVAVRVFAQTPSVSYSSPHTYVAGATITPLIPSATNIAVPGYGQPINLGSFTGTPTGIAVTPGGDVYIAELFTSKITKIPAAGGPNVNIGSGFSSPMGLASDASGNIYVADQGNHVIKRIAAVGGAITSLGTGLSAPDGVAVDSNYVYVADGANNTVVKIPLHGGAQVAVGSGYNTPTGVAVDANGNVYIADSGNNQVKKVTMTGGAPIIVTTGIGAQSIAVNAAGDIYVSDNIHQSLVMLPVRGGSLTVASPANLSASGVAVDFRGNVFITDQGNFNAIKVKPLGGFFISQQLPVGMAFDSPTGFILGTPFGASPAKVYSVIGYNSAGAQSNFASVSIQVTLPPLPTVSYATPQSYLVSKAITPLSPASTNVDLPGYNPVPTTLGSGFNQPNSIAVDLNGNIYVADQLNNAVKKLVHGTGAPVNIGTGFSVPGGVAVDAAGNVYVADSGNQLLKKIQVSDGSTITIAQGFVKLVSVAADASGNVYALDETNNSIYKYPSGTAVIGFNQGLVDPVAMAIDGAGNIYVADKGSKSIKEIPAGTSSLVTVMTGFTNLVNVAVDNDGSVYALDQFQSLVEKLPAGSTVSELYYSSLYTPTGLAIDNSGNPLIGSTTNNLINKYTPTGGYYLNAPLPVGLNFNVATGAISGTPKVVATAKSFTVAAYNVAGSASSALSIAIAQNNSTLTNLAVSGGALSPVFAAGTTTYTASVAVGTSSVTVTPTSGNASATIKVNGTLVKSGVASAAIPITVGSNPVTIVATGTDGITTYTINVTRIASNNPALASIHPGTGSLTPSFTANTLSYTQGVSNTTTSITVAPVVAQANATITVNGTAQASGATSPSIPLAVGANVITIVVTAEDGVTTRSYVDNVTRDLSTNANLSKLVPSAGTLSPAFAAATTSYTESVAGSVSSITVTPTAANANATIVVNGATVASGTASPAIPLSAGSNAINISVTAQDGVTQNFYAITVNKASNVATLSNVLLSSGTLSPVFAAATTSYTANVANAATSITVTPTATDINATIKINGTAVASGVVSSAIPLSVGTNVIKVVITAPDGVTTKTYTLMVTRAAANLSTNANLAFMNRSAGTMTPTFSSSVTSYAENVVNTVTSITITAKTSDANATMKINGTTVVSNTASAPIALAVGANVITTVVTAQDGVTTKTYTLTVTRAGSTNANLAFMNRSAGTMTPAFSSSVTSYAENVVNTVTSITITAKTSDANATMKINGTTVVSNTASAPIALAVGANVITTVVTAQDGVTTKTYTLTVTRGASTVASLSSLKFSGGVTLTPAFATATTSYTTSVPATTASVTVTPTTTDANATVKVNGAVVTSGTASAAIPLAIGSNVITTVVTAQNGTSTKTYKVTITKTASTNANLAFLNRSAGAMTPTFSSSVTSYSENVSNALTSITITAKTSDANATMKINGTTVVSNTASPPIALSIGTNVITAVVTAQDGTTTKTYTLTVTRANGPIGVINNLGLTLSDVETPADALESDNILVHQGVTPNGDGIGDFLVIDGITKYPDNKLMIMSRNGALVFEANGYDNSSRQFNGRSNKTGAMQLPGTYFYSLDYKVNGVPKHKTGFIILKY